MSAREIDPLLKDLDEKKQSFRRHVVSLAAELKETRSRLASQQQSCAKETLTRQESEARAKDIEGEISVLRKRLNEKNEQLQASAFTADKYMNELKSHKSQLEVIQATADASAASAKSAESQCLTLLKQLDEKNMPLKDHEDRVAKLGVQLDNLQKDLLARESSQTQLRDEVLRIERDIMQAVSKAGIGNNSELQNQLDEVSPKNLDRINKLLTAKDDEIAKLRDEIKITSTHWKLKTKELEDQLENQSRVDQELKKKVLKLEFCLREARAQTRRLQKMGEQRDLAIKEVRDQLLPKQPSKAAPAHDQNFWDKSGFKIVVSMSMLILVMFSRR